MLRPRLLMLVWVSANLAVTSVRTRGQTTGASPHAFVALCRWHVHDVGQRVLTRITHGSPPGLLLPLGATSAVRPAGVCP